MDRLVGGARAEGKDTVKVNPSDASSGLDTENGMLVFPQPYVAGQPHATKGLHTRLTVMEPK